jgi:hypothetical protein
MLLQCLLVDIDCQSKAVVVVVVFVVGAAEVATSDSNSAHQDRLV